MKFSSKITSEYFEVEASVFIMEPTTVLDSSGRGHDDEGQGYLAQTGAGAGHGAVGGYGKSLG